MIPYVCHSHASAVDVLDTKKSTPTDAKDAGAALVSALQNNTRVAPLRMPLGNKSSASLLIVPGAPAAATIPAFSSVIPLVSRTR